MVSLPCRCKQHVDDGETIERSVEPILVLFDLIHRAKKRRRLIVLPGTELMVSGRRSKSRSALRPRLSDSSQEPRPPLETAYSLSCQKAAPKVILQIVPRVAATFLPPTSRQLGPSKNFPIQVCLSLRFSRSSHSVIVATHTMASTM
jgi:hypothetical protein